MSMSRSSLQNYEKNPNQSIMVDESKQGNHPTDFGQRHGDTNYANSRLDCRQLLMVDESNNSSTTNTCLLMVEIIVVVIMMVNG